MAILLGACASPGSVPAPQAETQPAGVVAADAAAVIVPAATAIPGKAPTVSSGEGAARPAGGSIFFALGSSLIDPAAEVVLNDNAERLKNDPKLVVTLVGHADPLGSHSYNLAISERRVAAVASRLREMGVASKQIRRINYGKEQAAGVCHSEACRSRTWRVDLVYPKPKPPVRRVGKARK